MKRVHISSQEEIVPGARFKSQVRAPSLSAMGNQFTMTFSSPFGGFNAQLVELEELRRVGRAVVVRRQVWLELVGPCDAAQLGGEGAAALRCHRRPWVTKGLVLRVPMRCSWERRGVLTCWSRERPGSFLRARDFLAALFLPRWHLAERVPPRGHAPWGQGAFLRGRQLRRPRSFVARAGRCAVQWSGRRGGAPCDADEFGDAVEPFFVDVVNATEA